MDSRNFSLMDFMNKGPQDIMDLAGRFEGFQQDLFERRHLNYRRVSLDGSQPVMRVLDPYDGREREMLYFASNDYLNLTRHPKMIAAGQEALEKYGAGAGSVPLLGGTLDIHVELEKKVAAFKGCQAALVFSSGFGSNCGAIAALLGEEGIAILDTLVHASIIDGCDGKKTKFFRHNDMSSLESVLKRLAGRPVTKLIILDGVYSMDGDIAKLDQIVDLAHQYGALVMVDEAHATGVIGANGRGTPEHFGIEGKVDIVAGTCSKAIGVVGGFVASSQPIIEYLYYYARSYMFSTAPTPQAVASIAAALDIIQEEPRLRQKLWQNINYFRQGLLDLGVNLGNAETAIFPIIIGDDYKVKELCRELHENNIYVNPVFYPAVPSRLARVRFSLMQGHSREHLDQALSVLEHLLKKYECLK
ncbi:MAG: aminotransferase class I/II-fold pyridoxal phosphate-dependent enzyme [Clostridiales bacterium]|jgi:glycine C-acetyltransferase|nr:aminotransferase class I/II-fold pyridoxal phosphate-dependent enzyme [Clostridiales bacterium]